MTWTYTEAAKHFLDAATCGAYEERTCGHNPRALGCYLPCRCHEDAYEQAKKLDDKKAVTE